MTYVNGFFQLQVKKDGTFLKVFKPREGGKDIDTVEVSQYLESENIFDYDINALNKGLANANDGDEVRILFDPVYAADERMKIEVSEDSMKVTARFYPPSAGGELLTRESIVRLLQQQQITYGIAEYQIRIFLHHRQYCKDYIVANGTLPRQGKDAEITYSFEMERKAKPTLKEDGSVDFHQLDAINHIEKDALLATLHPEDLGEEGFDVYGTSLAPLKVNHLKLKHGKNIYESEDHLQIFSAVDGHVHIQDDTVYVSDTFEVLADVDPSTGDIEYDGNVDIKGNVRTGFTVKATGDINVKGVVEGAILEAGGKIVVHRGVQGMNRGSIKAKGDVCSKFLENCTVNSGGNVITEAIMHSEVFSKNNVIVSGKKGLITGGQVCSRKSIELKDGGSDMGTITKLEVGADPEIVEKSHKIAKEMPEIKRMMDQHSKVVEMYSKKLAKGEKLSPDKMVTLAEAKEEYEKLELQFKENQEFLEKYEYEIVGHSEGVIKVNGKLYPGVQVTIADVMMHIRKETQYCRLTREGADIKIGML